MWTTIVLNLLYDFFFIITLISLDFTWSYLTSLVMVTWQFILLLLGTQLIYTWYCLISLHCLEALDITWCHLTDLSLSGSSSQHWHWTWVAWDNLKQCQLSSSSSKSFQSKIGFSWWVVSWKLWMIYGYSQNIFRNVMSDKQFGNWCKKHSSRPRQRECTWWASIQFSLSKEGRITVDQGGENVHEEHLSSFCVTAVMLVTTVSSWPSKVGSDP